MKAAGCGPTAVADIYYNFNANITPPKVADWMTANGFSSYKQGTVWGGIAAYFNKHGAKAVQLNTNKLYGKRNSQAEKNWISKMQSGKCWGILCMGGPSYWTKGGHFIAVTEYRNGKYYVMDPASKDRTGWHPWADFSGLVKVFYLIDHPAKKTETKKETEYYAKYNGSSTLVDTVLEAVGVTAKYRGFWKKRKPLADVNGIKAYEGSAEQNFKLINLAKKGKLKKV
jgi:hypothetical protein